MNHYIIQILYEYSYFKLYLLTILYFLFLYFVVGQLFIYTCRFLENFGILHTIHKSEPSKKQKHFEIKHSLKSIVLFGFSIIPIIYLIRKDIIQLLPNNWYYIIIGLIILNLWNELHFYIVHRIMHTKFMMKNVHYIHHKSRVPTIYSVFSFHWLEAVLLSTVPLTIVPFLPFSILAIFIYPTTSILLNFAGHCNYRFGNGKCEEWTKLGTHHNQHHTKGKENYGFALNIFDKWFSQ